VSGARQDLSDFPKNTRGGYRDWFSFRLIVFRPQRKAGECSAGFSNVEAALTPILCRVAAPSRLIVTVVAFHRTLLRTSGTGLVRLACAAAVRLLTALLAGLAGALRIVRKIA
jgi:hypothetical protein